MKHHARNSFSTLLYIKHLIFAYWLWILSLLAFTLLATTSEKARSSCRAVSGVRSVLESVFLSLSISRFVPYLLSRVVWQRFVWQQWDCFLSQQVVRRKEKIKSTWLIAWLKCLPPSLSFSLSLPVCFPRVLFCHILHTESCPGGPECTAQHKDLNWGECLFICSCLSLWKTARKRNSYSDDNFSSFKFESLFPDVIQELEEGVSGQGDVLVFVSS